MKVVYVYLAVVFGGAAVAMVVYRYHERGVPGLVGLVGLVVVCTVTAIRQRRKQRAESQPAGDVGGDSPPAGQGPGADRP